MRYPTAVCSATFKLYNKLLPTLTIYVHSWSHTVGASEDFTEWDVEGESEPGVLRGTVSSVGVWLLGAACHYVCLTTTGNMLATFHQLLAIAISFSSVAQDESFDRDTSQMSLVGITHIPTAPDVIQNSVQ